MHVNKKRVFTIESENAEILAQFYHNKTSKFKNVNDREHNL